MTDNKNGEGFTLSPDIKVDLSNFSSEKKCKEVTKAKVSITIDIEVLQALKDNVRGRGATVSSLVNLLLKQAVYKLDRQGAEAYHNEMTGMEYVNILVRQELAEFLRSLMNNPKKYLKRDDYGIIEVANIITHCLLTTDRIIAFRDNQDSEIRKHNRIDDFSYFDTPLLSDLHNYMHSLK